MATPTPTPTTITSFLSDQEVAGQVAGALRSLDQQLVQARIEQAAEGRKDEDAMPFTEPAMTYGDRKTQLKGKQAGILKEFGSVAPQVQEIVDRQRTAAAGA